MHPARWCSSPPFGAALFFCDALRIAVHDDDALIVLCCTPAASSNVPCPWPRPVVSFSSLSSFGECRCFQDAARASSDSGCPQVARRPRFLWHPLTCTARHAPCPAAKLDVRPSPRSAQHSPNLRAEAPVRLLNNASSSSTTWTPDLSACIYVCARRVSRYPACAGVSSVPMLSCCSQRHDETAGSTVYVPPAAESNRW
jgi:hypothetical protein